MPNVSHYWSSAQWWKGREPESQLQRKTKGKIDLEKVSPFHFWGLVGFLDVHECLCRVSSDYRAAPTAVRNIYTVRPRVTDKVG